MWTVQVIRSLCHWALAQSVACLLLVLGVCAVLWWVEHQPLSHDCMFHGAFAHIIKDESGFRMFAGSNSPSPAAWDLRERSLAEVTMEPRFPFRIG